MFNFNLKAIRKAKALLLALALSLPLLTASAPSTAIAAAATPLPIEYDSQGINPAGRQPAAFDARTPAPSRGTFGNLAYNGASITFSTVDGRRHTYSRANGVITIPEGVYHVKQGNPHEHILIEGLNNAVIDAKGVEFVFENNETDGLKLYNCKNLTIRGLVLRYKTQSFTQGRIVAVGARHVDVALDAGYPLPGQLPRLGSSDWIMGIVFDPMTNKIKRGTYDLYDYDRVMEKVGNNYRLDCSNTSNVSVGDKIAIRGDKWPRTAITVNSEAVTFDSVTIKSGGAAFSEDNGIGGHIYRNCVVTTNRPADLLSVSADAFHSASMKKGPVLENCLFERSGDDGVNIHGSYGEVLSVDSKAKTFIMSWKSSWKSPMEIGDTVAVFDKGAGRFTELPNTALRVSRISDSAFLIGVGDVSSVKAGNLVYSTDRIGAGFTIRDTTVRNNRARGFLIKSQDGLIDGCVIDGSSMYAMLFDTELDEKNLEAFYPRNIAVVNCTYTNVNFSPITKDGRQGFVSRHAVNINGVPNEWREPAQ